jgi:hypothetical protein
MIALFQTASDVKEIVTIESVSAIGVLLLFLTYLIWQNHLLKKDIILRDNKISEIVAEHQKDLKEGNKDIITLVNKYHTFVEQLNNMTNGRR